VDPQEGMRAELTFELIRPPGRRSTFRSQLIEANAERIVLAHQAFPSKPLYYADEEVIGAGYPVVWFLFQNQPFDVGRFYRPDGTWTGYYVDILEPVRWDGSDPHTLRPIVDLFLDLWIAPDGGYIILDEDEFQDAVDQKYLSPAQSTHALTVLGRLVTAVEDGRFPPSVVKEFYLDEPR
jgi:predicted RNA-binding protein associated with RNAse of E/G family